MHEELLLAELEEKGYKFAAFSFRQEGAPRGKISTCWGNRICLGIITKFHPLPSGTLFGGMIAWKPVPGAIAPTDPDKKRLANFFSELPSQKFLDKVRDVDQLEEWLNIKTDCLRIARCLLAGSDFPDNPLRIHLEEGEIDKFKYDYLSLIIEYYTNLWWLLNTKHQKISKRLKNKGYQRTTPLFLVSEIARANIEGEFQQIFKSSYSFSEYDLRLIAQLGKKLINDELEEEKGQLFEKLLRKHSTPSIWLDRVLEVCGALAKHDRLILAALQKHYAVCRAMYSMLDDATHKPEIRFHAESYSFLNGKRYQGVNKF